MKFRDFAPWVQPDCPGCPLFQVEMAVREAAIIMLSKVDLYRADPEMLNVLPGVTQYDLEAPAGYEPSRVLELTNGGRSLKKVASEIEIYELLDKHPEPTTPTHYYQHFNDSIILAPTPKDALQLRLFLSLRPNATCTAIPDNIGKEYRDVIASGAKARLQLMAGQPWSNPQFGGLNKQLFDRAVSAAIRRYQFGFSGAPITVKKRDLI